MILYLAKLATLFVKVAGNWVCLHHQLPSS
jgi:hypothetical protein